MYAFRFKLAILRARLVPPYLKYRYWEYLSRQVAHKYSVAPPLPAYVYFETRTRCNSHCRFCPASVGNDTREDSYMPEETFRKCIDELAELDYHGVVGLWNYNEPLLDRRIAELVRYATERLPRATTAMLTNGLLLTPERGKALLDAGLKSLTVDNYSDKGRVPEGVKRFFQEVAPSYTDREIILGERLLSGRIKNLAGWSPNNRKPVYLRAFCPYPFTDMVITTNGNVGLCCNDFLFQEVMGNVSQDSLVNVWRGERFRFIRENLLRGNRACSPLCRKCDTSSVLFRDAHLLGPINRFAFRYLVGIY